MLNDNILFWFLQLLVVFRLLKPADHHYVVSYQSSGRPRVPRGLLSDPLQALFKNLVFH